jgi:hypothetical protein
MRAVRAKEFKREDSLVPLAGIEPALLAESDFECSLSAKFLLNYNTLAFSVQY